MVLKILVALSILLLFAPGTTQAQPVSDSAWSYTEHLDMFLVGDNILWKIYLSGGNISLPSLPDVEAEVPGIYEYSIFSADGSSWMVDYEIFSKRALNQLLSDPIPINGIFLKVRASDSASASRFASLLNPLLRSAFVEYSSSEGEYIFYSHTDFNILVREHLWLAMPVQLEGIASLLDPETFLSNGLPMLLLEGKRSNNTFTRSLTLSSVEPSTIKDNNFTLAEIFPHITRTNASSLSNSTTITFQLFGSLIKTSSGAEAANSYEDFTSSMTSTISPGKPLPNVNATVESSFPSLIATRETDRGSLNIGESAEVRLRLHNSAPPGAPDIENITIREEWWTPYFEKIEGNSTLFVSRLTPGESRDLVYVIQAKDDQPIEITQSPEQNQIQYSYKVGNRVLRSETFINDLRMSLNEPKSAISAVASLTTKTPSANSSLILDINNFGTRTAFNLEAFIDEELVGKNQNLLPGANWRILSNITFPSYKVTHKTVKSYVRWTEEDTTKETSANSVNVFCNFSEPKVATLKISKEINTLNQADGRYLSMNITLNNIGRSAAYGVDIKEDLPDGIEYVNGSFIAKNGKMIANIQHIEAGMSTSLQYYAEIKESDENFVILPTMASMSSKSGTIQFLSNSHVLPMGIKVEKNFAHLEGFPGSNLQITVKATNEGHLPIYNINLISGSDPFLSIVEGNTSAKFDALAGDEVIEIVYSTNLLIPGRHLVSSATITFTFSGTSATTNSAQPTLEIYEPVNAQLSVNPQEPIEGEPFDLMINISNPSKLSLADVQIRIMLPASIQILESWTPGNADLLNVGEMAANDSRIFVAKVKAPSSMELLVDPPEVTFTYRGEALKGNSNSLILRVQDDILGRYGLPIGIGVAIALITVVLLRRSALGGVAK